MISPLTLKPFGELDIKLKNKKYEDFSKKLFYRIIFISFISLFIVSLALSFFSGRLGNFVVKLLQTISSVDYEESFYIYHNLIRKNKNLIIVATFFSILLIMFRVLINFMSNYFDEISRGLDILLEESDKDISLSKEMNFLENRLKLGKEILKNRRKDAQDAEDRKNDLIMYLAHDLKTPLTSIIGYLNLLVDMPFLSPDEKLKYIELVLDKAYHLENLINEIFEITKLNSKRLPLNKERFNLNLMLNQLADEFYPILVDNSKSISLNLEANIYFYGDSSKLGRAFKNLIKNAIFYSPANSKIKINSRLTNNKILVQFINPSSPLSKDDLVNIFTEFYRLDKSRSTKTGGTGLGLLITKEIVEAHGGKIWAEYSEGQIIFNIVLDSKM